MVDEPDVVKELREAEKLGMLQSKGQNSYKLLHVMEENTKDVSYEKSDFGEDYVEKRYHLIADITSDLICTTTFKINPTYIYVNPSYKRILGYTPDDMIGKPVWDFMHPDDKKDLLPLLKKYIGMKAKKLLTGKNASISEKFESRIKDKSGCWHYLETTANVIDNELVLISKDVTERKKAEDTLKQSEERYQRLFNSSPDAIMETDRKGVVLAVNSSMVKGLGVKPEDLIGKDCKDILPKPVYEKRVAIGRKALNENKIQVDEDKRAGKYFHNIFIPIITQDGKKNLMIIARDITKRKEAEEELKESEEKYRELFNNALVGIYIHNADGSINSVNKLAENVFGLSEEELKKKDLAFWKGKLLNSNGEPMTSEELPLAVVANSKKPSEGDVIGLRMSKNDKPRWFLHGARPILDKDGEIDKVVTSFIEITERKELEESKEKTLHKLEERIKELRCLYEIDNISIKKDITIEKFFRETVNLLPASLQYPRIAASRIIFADKEYRTEKFRETKWMQRAEIIINNEKVGHIELCYLEEKPEKDEGTFLSEEKNLIDAVARRIELIIDRKQVLEKLRSLIESTSDWVWEVDKNGVYTYASPKVRDMLGYEPEEVVGKTPFDFMIEDEKKRVGKIFQNIIESKGPIVALENVNMHKDGRHIVLETSATPILDVNGNLQGYRGIDREITERKKAEKEIQYLKEYNENILESNPNPIIVIKGKQIEYVNKSFISIFGKTKNDYISKNLKDAVPVKIIPVFEELMQNNNKTKELEVKGKNFVANSFIVKKAEEEEEEEEERNGIIFQDITELKESKEKFKVLFDTSRDAIMTLSPPTWFFTSGNKATIDLFNAKDENEFTTKGPWNISPKHQPDGTPSDQKAKQMIQQAVKQGSKFFEWTHMTLDGKEFPATVLLTRVEIEPGKPFLQATVRDISKQKKFEEEIIETNNIINTSPIVVFLWKNEEGWPVEFVSQNVKKLFGYKAEDFTKGKVLFTNTIHPDDLKNVAKEVEKHSKEKTSKEFTQKYRIKTKNQKIKWIEDRTIIRRDEHGKITHYQGIIWDITDRVKLESSLKTSMKKYQDLIEGSRDGYIMTDINDNIIQYNTMFKNMTGYTDKELKDKKLIDLTPVEWHKKTIEIDKQTLKNGYSEIYEKEIIRKDGRIIPAEFRKYLVKEDGKPKAVWSYVRDITERKQIEEEIVEKIKTLEKYKNLTVGRELRIIELKEKVKKLEEKLGERKK